VLWGFGVKSSWVKNKNEPDGHVLIPFFSAFRRPEMPDASVLAWSGPLSSRWLRGSELPSVGEAHVREQKNRLAISSRSFTENVINHVT